MRQSNRKPLLIEHFSIGKIKLDPRNPLHHSPGQIVQIAKSIESFGFNVPVLLDSDNKVIAGHGRVLACQRLGLSSVPVIRLDHLTPSQARAFNIADNKLAENAQWNDRLLGEIFAELSTQDLDFNIEATGFSVAEIDLCIEGLSELPAGGPDPADEPQGLAAHPVSNAGDCWTLGRHRLFCGSALDRASYQRLMQGEKANLIFADPPFNVRIDGYATGKGRIHHREFAMAAGEFSVTEFTNFLTTVFCYLAASSTDGSIHFVCMDWRHQPEILTAGAKAYSELKNLCVWTKNTAGLGSLYRSQHELVFVYKSGRGKHRNNIELGRHGRHRSNVWKYPGVNTFGRKGEEGDLFAEHPTVKPVAMVADAILDCSARGDIVLDPFVGSGTTLIAAERVGRICRAIELDPLYVDSTIRRWQRHTGDHATNGENGRRFDDIAAEKETENGR